MRYYSVMRVHFKKGMSLVDVIVGIALLLIVFLALFGILRASLLISSLAKNKAGATTVSQIQMEFLRSLSYDTLGTQGGIPAGSVLQDATTTENGVNYATHTFIKYVDDPADGTGVNDTNGIITDYKRARIDTTYTVGGKQHSVILVSNFAPPGLETTNGGGTLKIHIINAQGGPVVGATVGIINAATSPTINITTATNNDGIVFLPGAATSSEYRIAVSKGGYSSAQTYTRDTTNQNPNPGYLTVIKDQTTTGTFAIDLLSSLSMSTFSPIATSTFSDNFIDTSKLITMSSTTVAGGTLTLKSGEQTGTARSVATSSPYLIQWDSVMSTTTIPSGTAIRLHIYGNGGILIPDTVLPGNAVGFSSSPISITSISTTTYSSLSIGATLTTTTSSTSPDISAWSLSYRAGPFPLGNVPFTLTGMKTKGATGSGSPIYKTIITAATGNGGVQGITTEWDTYTLSLPGNDVIDACPSPPYSLAPGNSTNATLILGTKTTNALRVFVTDNVGTAVSGANVTLARTGFSEKVPTSSCGSAYFGNITSANDYTVTIAKSGYTTTNFPSISATGMTTYNASFP